MNWDKYLTPRWQTREVEVRRQAARDFIAEVAPPMTVQAIVIAEEKDGSWLYLHERSIPGDANATPLTWRAAPRISISGIPLWAMRDDEIFRAAEERWPGVVIYDSAPQMLRGEPLAIFKPECWTCGGSCIGADA